MFLHSYSLIAFIKLIQGERKILGQRMGVGGQLISLDYSLNNFSHIKICCNNQKQKSMTYEDPWRCFSSSWLWGTDLECCQWICVCLHVCMCSWEGNACFNTSPQVIRQCSTGKYPRYIWKHYRMIPKNPWVWQRALKSAFSYYPKMCELQFSYFPS